jgi:Methane oxygenase PmoA
MGMTLRHGQDWIGGRWQDTARPRGGPDARAPESTELFRYKYRPQVAAVESPRPYFHPVRTLAGDVVTLYRPHDHLWHIGISWGLSNVGQENFWGGTTYRRGAGYQQFDNNGRIQHEGFGVLEVQDDVLRFSERLTWITHDGQTWIEELRRVCVSVLADRTAWRLSYATSMQNVSGRLIPIGSPTTEGRPDAGYSGLFWRGPRSFSGGAFPGGTVLTPDGPGDEELMGWRGPWLGYAGQHDGAGSRASTLVFCDRPGNVGSPCQWFVRTGIYGCVCPAPFFSHEYPLEDGRSLALGYDILIADGALDVDRCAQLARSAREPAGRAAAGPADQELQGAQP